MTRLFHVSDIHFGAEDKHALAWFAERVRVERPDAVVFTGDLTMRARRSEFEAAAEWLGALDRPTTVEVGNHDLPYFNPLRRVFRPYRRYRAVERMIEQPLEIEGVAVVPMKTTARFQWRLNWSKGHVGRHTLRKTRKLVTRAAETEIVFVACHHPLIEAGTKSTSRTRRGARALAALAEAGVDAVLSGHVHDPFDIAHVAEGGGTVRLIGAGTLSERTREAPASFNEIRIEAGAIEVVHRLMEQDIPT